MKDINVGRMFSKRIQISHRTEAFEKNLSQTTIYGTANAQIDFRDESKERWVVSSESSHCARDIPRLRWTIKSMAAAKCTVGVYRKDTILDLYATKNPLRYGIFDVKSHDLLPHRLAPGFNF